MIGHFFHLIEQNTEQKFNHLIALISRLTFEIIMPSKKKTNRL